MKKLFFLLFSCVLSVNLMAQSDYISHSPMENEDRIGDLDDNCGVLILSKRSDLVITVTNSDSYSVVPKGNRADGIYEYEIIIDRTSTKEAKIEVNRRGDVYKTNFVVKIKPNFFRAYMIDEVQRPIRMEDQSQANDAVLNAELAEVEFTSSIPDLIVKCPDALGATVTTKNKVGDNSIIITSVKIPIKVLEAARQKQEKTAAAYAKLHKKLVDSPDGDASDSDWEMLDRLEEEAENAENELRNISNIFISGNGTNLLHVDISDLKPRKKVCYGVLLLKVEVPVNEFSAKIAEGGRLFSLREYDGARRSFSNALSLEEATEDLIPTVRTNIAQCDSCLLYERYAAGALSKMKKMRDEGNGTQEEVVKYASAALEFLQVLNRYNPCDFYSSRIEKLENIIEDMPLDIKFTIVKWENNYAGFFEGARIPNVEIWAHFGSAIPGPNDYKNDRSFNKLMGSPDYRKLGESDEDGEIELHLDRKSLPVGLFFRPVGYKNKIKIKYMDVKDVLRQSEGTYNKRQFRLKMYTIQ